MTHTRSLTRLPSHSMPRPGIHPMLHLTRLVLTDGSSYMVSTAWQLPKPGLQITTKILEEDYLTHESYTGKPSKLSKKLGRRAKFENKFAGKDETSR